MKVNCASLPATLIESELFGHEKGAFTGATSRRQGRFELAHGGTIFLDEVGELPLELQAKFLRVLQEGEFERLGGAETRIVDVRVIAATNVDLAAMVRNGQFRADLYYRLNVFPLALPPLRDRPGDIARLATSFAATYAKRFCRPSVPIPEATMVSLQSYPWPGNVRELMNIIERAMIVSSDGVIRVEGLQLTGIHLASPPSLGEPSAPGVQSPGVSASAGGMTLEEAQSAHIRGALERANWRVEGEAGAARMLDLNPSTLRSRMRKLGIRR